MRDVVAYLATLPPLPPVRLGDAGPGNAPSGAKLYRAQCVACHGERAEGKSALGAPALAPLQTWYQQTQLRNFRSGLRGADPADAAAASMRAAATTLGDGPALADVMAYVRSLRQRAAP